MSTDLTEVEAELQKAAEAFAHELIGIVRRAPAYQLGALRAAAEPAAEAPPKPRRKRAWPTCSVEGCERNVYMPSGALKVCYTHHLEAGGRPTPLAKYNESRKT